MQKAELQDQLSAHHRRFAAYIGSLTADELVAGGPQKWTPSQQLKHIYLSIRPLRLVLYCPAPVLGWIWGKANRPSRHYDEVVKKYLQRLQNGGRATGRFIPADVPWTQKEALLSALEREIILLNRHIDRLTEDALDRYILPHPLLGKLTIREMLYFSIYHVTHHQKSIERMLGG